MSKLFGNNDGETIKTPGMVRWFNNSHYFLKRIGTRSAITKPNTFVLGLETRFGDNAYSYISGIEFDNDEAPDLMDRIAAFNGLPKYTDLLATREALQNVLNRLNSPIYSSGVNKSIIKREIELALKGETID